MIAVPASRQLTDVEVRELCRGVGRTVDHAQTPDRADTYTVRIDDDRVFTLRVTFRGDEPEVVSLSPAREADDVVQPPAGFVDPEDAREEDYDGLL